MDKDSDDDLLGEQMEQDNGNQLARKPTPTSNGSKTRVGCLHPHTPVVRSSLGSATLSNCQVAPVTKSYLDAAKNPSYVGCGNSLLGQFESVVNGTVSIGFNPLAPSTSTLLCPAPKPQAHRPDRGKWGPIVATRMSNKIKRDGKNSIAKAQEIKKCKTWKYPKVS